MIYFFNLQKKKKKKTLSLSHKSHKGYRLLIYMVPHDSPLWTSAIYSKHELLTKIISPVCVAGVCSRMKLKVKIYPNSLGLKKKKKQKRKQPVEVTNPYTHTRTQTNQTHTFLSICSWHDVGETRRICVMCRWAVAARPWFKEKQSFTSATNHVPRFTAGLRGSD